MKKNDHTILKVHLYDCNLGISSLAIVLFYQDKENFGDCYQFCAS